MNWIFENPLFATTLKGALKALTWVSLATFDFKLAIIVKSLENYVSESEESWKKEEEKRKQEKQQFGLY